MNLKLDGKWTKLLKAFAELHGLEHLVEFDSNGVRIEVFVKNMWYSSVIDVFKEGQVACVSSLSKYVRTRKKTLAEAVEEASKEILEGTFGEGRYLMSMKGGGYMRVGNQLAEVPWFVAKDLSRSLDEFMMHLDLAGIDCNQLEVTPKKQDEKEEQEEEQ